MTAPQEPAEEPSRPAGAGVLAVLGGMVVAVAFAVDEAAGVLTVVVSSTVALWRTARRMSDSSATPPPRGAAPSRDVLAGETGEIARVVRDPSGVMCTYHPVREEVTGE